MIIVIQNDKELTIKLGNMYYIIINIIIRVIMMMSDINVNVLF